MEGARSSEILLPMYLQDAVVSQFNGHDLYHSVYLNPFKPSGFQNLCVLPTQSIYVDLGTNSGYFATQY
jgi:hypothetical protein